jgi:hypothetical protein
MVPNADWEDVWPERKRMLPLSQVKTQTRSTISTLLRLRRSHPALSSARTELVLASGSLLVLERGEPDDAIRIYLNPGEEAVSVPETGAYARTISTIGAAPDGPFAPVPARSARLIEFSLRSSLESKGERTCRY